MFLLSAVEPDGAELGGSVLFILAVILFSAVLYFMPTIAAWKKQCRGSVFVLNFFLGWTLVGWVVAFAWALKDPEPVRTAQIGPPALCAGCGRYSTGDSRFCNSCGNSLVRA